VNTDKIFELVERCTLEILPELALHQFSRHDRLSDLGANSIDRAEIITLVLESISLDIPRSELVAPKNLGELADLLYQKTLPVQ
jgi:polyketide biosynthesis acyl carrier protein